jgi:probable F420-dependent oxidoreductase
MSQTATTTIRPRAAGLGPVGVWSGELRGADPVERDEAAAELESLGYGALWIPGGVGGPVLQDLESLLAATTRLPIATGIINVWKHEPSEIGDWWTRRTAAQQGRLMLGLGISHGPLIGEGYGRPIAKMTEYLDALDAQGVPAARRCLAALGPRMLDLARDRSAGAHPYLTPPEHTALARERLGPDALLAPEMGVVLETEPGKAREIARQGLGIYMQLPNYVNNWRRLGFSEADVTGPSDGLVDALFAWGSLEQIRARVQAHLDAGADHVCLQVIRGPMGEDLSLPRQAWRSLAEALL